MLAVACSHRIRAGTGTSRADALAAVLPRSAWQRYSAGPGAKGHRWYDWAWTSIEPRRRGCRWLLIRRSIRTGELAFYRCYSPRPVPLTALVQVAGRRWAVEEDFQAAKGLTGLDEHQVRRWDSWYRWTTPGHARRRVPDHHRSRRARPQPQPQDQIPLTRNEIGRLLATLIIWPAPGTWHRLRWSDWRRRHQHRARTSHYQRQARQL